MFLKPWPPPKTTVKELVPEGVGGVIKARNSLPVRRLRLLLVDSANLGSLQLDNDQIYDLISSPDVNVWRKGLVRRGAYGTQP